MTEATLPDALENLLRGSRELTHAYLKQVERTDPEALAGVAAAITRGAVVRVTVSTSAAGLAEVAIDLVDLQGTVANLAHVGGLDARQR